MTTDKPAKKDNKDKMDVDTTATKKAGEEPDKAKETKKPKGTPLEEDDEFEDFPADKGWEDGAGVDPLNQWEDAWEDDDDAEDFSELLKVEYQRKKAGAAPMKM